MEHVENFKLSIGHPITGYRDWREHGSIVKQFLNVAVNMCWAHSISTVGAREALSELLEILQTNKIIGLGGNIDMPEEHVILGIY